jgi:D-amino peptidase
MKVYISVDMEGISGLVRWPDVVSAGIDFGRNRRLMTADANAAIEGAFDAGATEVVVEENHGIEDLCVLLMDEIDARCRVVRGAGRPTATTMAALDSDCAVVLLVGHHACAGSNPGIMAHTIYYGKFKAVRLAGQPVGESELFTIRAGELGVPVGLVTGDQVVAEQLHKRAPWVDAVVVKRALSNVSGDLIPPARAREAIRAGASGALERLRAGELQPYRGEPAPYEFEVELGEPICDDMRRNLETMEEFEIEGDRLVRIIAEDMDLGFRRVAYLGFANLPGVTRY